MKNILWIRFRDQDTFEKAVDHFTNFSDFYADEINDEFKSIGFEASHGGDTDNLEWQIDQEIQNSFDGYWFEAEDINESKRSKLTRIIESMVTKKLKEINLNESNPTYNIKIRNLVMPLVSHGKRIDKETMNGSITGDSLQYLIDAMEDSLPKLRMIQAKLPKNENKQLREAWDNPTEEGDKLMSIATTFLSKKQPFSKTSGKDLQKYEVDFVQHLKEKGYTPRSISPETIEDLTDNNYHTLVYTLVYILEKNKFVANGNR